MSLALAFRLFASVFLPLAFSMMPLSMAVIIGAMSTAAEPADAASEAILRPNPEVFQFLFSKPLTDVVIVEVALTGTGTGMGNEAANLGVGTAKALPPSSLALWYSVL